MTHEELSGRVLIVTGGATGIGRATVEMARSRGAHIVVVGRPGSELEQTSRELGVEIVAGDAADPATARLATSRALELWGRIDALVGCAGRGEFGSLVQTDAAAWDEVVSANLGTAVAMCREVVPHLIAGGGGNIVLVSSLAGVLAVPGSAAYTVAKHAVVGLVRSLAADYGPQGVRTNAVCPGPVRTAMFDQVMEGAAARLGLDRRQAYERAAKLNPRRAVAEPGEIAEIILFLAGPRSAAVNGAVLMADGGVAATDLSMSALATGEDG